MRLAIVASHPIQYHAPLFRVLAQRFPLKVFFAHNASARDQAEAGFGVAFTWDSDLLSGFDHVFLQNAAKKPGLDHFAGCDTPGVRAALVEGKFDAVLILGWHFKSYLQAALAAKTFRIPLLVRGDSHLDTPRSVAKKVVKILFYPPMLRLFDAALYVGVRSHAYWRHYRYPEVRLFFSPHCVDTEWFASRATIEAGRSLRETLGIAPNANVALFAGKLVAFKRPTDLIAAASRIKAEGGEIAVLVAGAGPLEAEIAAFGRASGVVVHHLGFCNQTKMPAVYAAADVLVLPSDGRETWGLVANEALACGRPIVLADTVGAAPDLAADGTAGRTYPGGDIGALSETLRAVLRAPPLKSMIAAKSTAYGLEIAADGIELAASRVLSKRTGHRRPMGLSRTRQI